VKRFGRSWKLFAPMAAALFTAAMSINNDKQEEANGHREHDDKPGGNFEIPKSYLK
jgi:hypothetical protein